MADAAIEPPAPGGRGSRRDRWPAILTLLALAGVALFAFLSPRGLLSGDFGMKWVQAQSLWEQGFRTRTLAYDIGVDPGLTWLPYGFPYVRLVDDAPQGIYSFVFAALTAPFVGGLGFVGARLVGLLGGAALLLGAGATARGVGLSPRSAAAAAALATCLTPALFYAAPLSEHAPAAGLLLLALAETLRDPAVRGARATAWDRFRAGLWIGAAVTLRPDACCGGVALAISAALADQGARTRVVRAALMAAGALVVAAPYWTVNLLTAGAWDPLVGANDLHRATWFGAQVMLFGDMGRAGAAWWVCGGIALLLFGLTPAASSRGGRAALGITLVVLAVVAQRRSQAAALDGLLSITPIAGLGLVVPRPLRAAPGRAWTFAVLFVAQILAFDSTGIGGGLQVGARMLLPALPVLLILALASLSRDLSGEVSREVSRGGRAGRGVSLAVAVALGGVSLFGDRRAMTEGWGIAAQGARALSAVEATGATSVVTRRWWESLVLAPALSSGRRIFLVRAARQDLAVLLSRLGRRGEDVVALTSRDPPPEVPGFEVRSRQEHGGLIPVSRLRLTPRR